MDPHKCCCNSPGLCAFHKCVVSRDALKKCRSGEIPKKDKILPCMHLREEIGDNLYKCVVHGKCQLQQFQQGIADCLTCQSRVPLDADENVIREKWRDNLRITDSSREPTEALRNLLKGKPAFLVLGGPSAAQMPLERLTERGVWSLAVNNAAAKFRVNAFVCSDPPSKFHDGVWKDPSVMKFVPTPKLKGHRAKLRTKNKDGSFSTIAMRSSDAPNTWGFGRRSWLIPDYTWFLDDAAPWGNHQAGAQKTGQPKVVGTMLLGLRLLQYLGARKIFLVGCDFWMNPRGQRYSFAEDKNEGGVNGCNEAYKVLNMWLTKLRPVFERFGFETYNCYRKSRLTAFDYVPFEYAIDICKEDFPEVPLDTHNWYLK